MKTTGNVSFSRLAWLLCVALVLLATPPSRVAAQFVVEEGIDVGLESSRAGKSCITVDGSDRPRIGYIGTGRSVRYAKRDSDGGWTVVPIEPNDPCSWPSVRIDADELEHFGYSCNFAGGPGDERMIYRPGTGGSNMTLGGTEGNPAGEGNDMAIDDAGIHVTFYDDSQGSNTGFVYRMLPRGSSDFTFESVLPANAFLVQYDRGLSIDVDASGTPFIAYVYDDNGPISVRIARRDAAGSWTVVTVPASDGVLGQASMAIGPDDTIYIAYLDGDDFKVSRSTPSLDSWSTEIIEGLFGLGFSNDIAVGDDGGVHIAVCNGGDRLLYATKGSPDEPWDVVEVDPAPTYVPSITVDSVGDPHLGYVARNDNSQYELRYARRAVRSIRAVAEGGGQLQVVVGPDVIVNNGWLRRGGETDFRPMNAFSTQDGVLWTAQLASGDYSMRGLEYYLFVSAGGTQIGVGAPDAPRRLFISVENQSVPGLRVGGYRMVSAPMHVTGRENTNALLQSVYGASGTKAFLMGRWDPDAGEYVNVDAGHPEGFDLGAAYWLGVAQNKGLALDGVSHLPAFDSPFFELPLRPGWNQVGNPFGYRVTLDPAKIYVDEGNGDIPFADAVTSGLVGSSILIYNPSQTPPYSAAGASLDPWNGCWIENLTTQELTFGFPAEEAPAAKTEDPFPAQQIGWLVSIRAGAGGEQARVELGLQPESTEGRDPQDIGLPPHPPGQRLVLGVVAPTAAPRPGRLLWRDVRPPAAGVSWPLYLHSPQDPVTLSWTIDRADTPPPGFPALVDRSSGRTWNLDELRSVTLQPGEYRFDVVLQAQGGSTGPALGGGALPLRLSPNPFASLVAIRYQLPQDGSVVLSAYDLRGRRIWTESRPGLGAGIHELLWDGTNGEGGRVAAGTYVLRVEFAGRGDGGSRLVSQRKFTILR